MSLGKNFIKSVKFLFSSEIFIFENGTEIGKYEFSFHKAFYSKLPWTGIKLLAPQLCHMASILD